MKVLDIVNAKPIFEKLLLIKLPIKLCYRINKIIQQIDTEYTCFEKSRHQLILELGEKNENGTTTVLPDNEEKFYSSMNELLNEEVVINFQPLPLDAFPDTLELTPQQLNNIDCFLE